MRKQLWLAVAAAVVMCVTPASAEWVEMFNGKDLDGWEPVGDGIWTVMRDGTILGQRDLKNAVHQAWLYSRKDYGEFDLQLEYWTRHQGNSGISIRDTSRARWAVGEEWDRNRTPSHIGYEIQISMGYAGRYASGSVYLFDEGKPGVQIDNDWNHLEIQSRNDAIRIYLNGQLVSEHPGDSARPKAGPIGFQLHDRNSVVMFRKVRIREISSAK